MTAREGIREAVDQGEETLAEGVAQLRDSAQDAESWVRERTNREPLLALAVAVAAGFVLGRLLSRRS